jgi:cytochrome P450
MPHPGYFKAHAATAYLYNETMKAVAARRATGSGQRDILGLLLAARDAETGRAMTDSELTANLYSFLIAGHETSTVALGWSLWLLAKDQASQDRLREEVANCRRSRDRARGGRKARFHAASHSGINASVPTGGDDRTPTARGHYAWAVQSLNARTDLCRDLVPASP